MHEALVKEMRHTILPPFPPKKWLGNLSKSFILKRTADLKTYFKRLMLVKGISQCPTLLSLLTPDRSIPLTVVSSKPDAQTDFIKGCLSFVPADAVPPPEYDAFVALRVKLHSEQLLPVDMIIEGKLVRVVPSILNYEPKENTKNCARCYNGDLLMLVEGGVSRRNSLLAQDSNSRSVPNSLFCSFASVSDTPAVSFRAFRNFLRSLTCT